MPDCVCNFCKSPVQVILIISWAPEYLCHACLHDEFTIIRDCYTKSIVKHTGCYYNPFPHLKWYKNITVDEVASNHPLLLKMYLWAIFHNYDYNNIDFYADAIIYSYFKLPEIFLL